MSPKNFAELFGAIETWLEESDHQDCSFVYPMLAEHMALAARQVYDACSAGQAYAQFQEPANAR
jgi:hypothetical protein